MYPDLKCPLIEGMADHEEGPGEDFSKLLGDCLEAAGRDLRARRPRPRGDPHPGPRGRRLGAGAGKEGRRGRRRASRAARRASPSTCSSPPCAPSEIRLSIHPTDKNIAQDLKEAFESRRPIEGLVVEVCKGGVRVSVKGKSAFCPISQLTSGASGRGRSSSARPWPFASRSSPRKGEASSFRAGSCWRSRRAPSEPRRQPRRVHRARRVSRLEKFGAFIELLPGVEGAGPCLRARLVAPWVAVGPPLAVGQSIAVKILKHETVEGGSRSRWLSNRPPRGGGRGGPPPSSPILGRSFTPPGRSWRARSPARSPYGLFVQLEPGVVGLLHSVAGRRPSGVPPGAFGRWATRSAFRDRRSRSSRRAPHRFSCRARPGRRRVDAAPAGRRGSDDAFGEGSGGAAVVRYLDAAGVAGALARAMGGRGARFRGDSRHLSDRCIGPSRPESACRVPLPDL